MNYTKKFFDNHYYNEPIFQTDNFIVVPSVGSLVEGWLLIIPKVHYLSFGAINDSHIYQEVDLLIETVGTLIKSVYGEYIIFEHGPVAENSEVGCSVDYAHLHIVPVDLKIEKGHTNLLGLDLNWEEVDGIATTSKYISNNIPYLYYSNSQKSLITTHSQIPSQFFRKVIADSLDISYEWNWKEYPFHENVQNTIKNLTGFHLSVLQ